MGKGKRRNPGPQVEVVTETPHLEEVCAALREAGLFAFDTEFIKEDRFAPVVCLLQAATDKRVVLVDPLASGMDVSPLWQLVADDDVEVVVHAGAEDLALCYRHLGRPPARVFDVQIAAGLVGFDYPLSLMRLLRSVVGVRLHKSQTLTDWQRRPLSETQQRYAADDVAHLPAVHRLLEKRLAKLSRRAWAAEEFSRLEQAATCAVENKPPLASIKGTGSLDARRLAVARELAVERQALAERLNRPVRAVLRDHLLVEIARRGWTRPEDIRSLRGISLNDRAIRQLCGAVKRAQALPAEQWPAPIVLAEETPQESVVISLVTAVIRAYCLDSELAFPLVTNKQDIRSTVLARVRAEAPSATPALLCGWRHAALGPLLERVLSGACGVRLAYDEQGPKLAFDGSD